MSYSKFKLSEVVEQFGLKYQKSVLFPTIKPLKLGETWQKVLDAGVELALPSGSEQARKSNIVYPILMDLREKSNKEIAIYAGFNLGVDAKLGLNGECDFILSISKTLDFIMPPIFILVEAERHDIELGLGQCAAQMVGAMKFNEKRKAAIKTIYGCVTTGAVWQFLKLENNELTISNHLNYLDNVEEIVGIFQYIVDSQ